MKVFVDVAKTHAGGRLVGGTAGCHWSLRTTARLVLLLVPLAAAETESEGGDQSRASLLLLAELRSRSSAGWSGSLVLTTRPPGALCKGHTEGALTMASCPFWSQHHKATARGGHGLGHQESIRSNVSTHGFDGHESPFLPESSSACPGWREEKHYVVHHENLLTAAGGCLMQGVKHRVPGRSAQASQKEELCNSDLKGGQERRAGGASLAG